MSRTKLTDLATLDIKNVIFGVKQETIKNSNMKFFRVTIKIKHPDGSIGDFFVKLPYSYCFGVKETTDLQTGEHTGYNVTFCLGDRNSGPNEEQKILLDKLNEFLEAGKDYLYNNCAKFKKSDYRNRAFLASLNKCLYYKKDPKTMEVIEGAVPCFKTKVTAYKKKTDDGQNGWDFITRFYEKDLDNNSTIIQLNDPLKYMGIFTNAFAVIKFDNIFIGQSPSLQTKLIDCIFDKKDDQNSISFVNDLLPGIQITKEAPKLDDEDATDIDDLPIESNGANINGDEAETEIDAGGIGGDEIGGGGETITDETSSEKKRGGGRKKKVTAV